MQSTVVLPLVRQPLLSSLEKGHLEAACPFTLCRGFFTPKIGPVPPKLQGLSICRGTKLRKKQQLYPQFQNSVGTLWVTGNEHILNHIALYRAIRKYAYDLTTLCNKKFLLFPSYCFSREQLCLHEYMYRNSELNYHFLAWNFEV